MILQARDWHRAHSETLRLCRVQQALENDLIRDEEVRGLGAGGGTSSAPSASPDAGRRYLHLVDAEQRAAHAADTLLEELARTPAQTMPGIVAKLEAVLIESEIRDNPTDFPFPHIRSVLADLQRHTAIGSVLEPAETREVSNAT